MRTLRLIGADGTPVELHRYDLTGRDVHVDAPLSQILMDYRPSGFIADQVVPIVTVAKQSDMFYRFEQSDLWRIPDTTRSPMTAAKRADFNVASETYYAKNYALATGLSIEDAINADAALSLRENKAKFVTDLIMLDYENRVATLAINTSNVGTMAIPTSAANVSAGLWSLSGADPILDIDSAQERVRTRGGYRANRIVFGWEAWLKFKRHANVRAQVFPAAGGTVGNGGVITPDHARALFDAEWVGIAGTMRNTAAEGLSQTLAQVWGPHVFVYYAPDRPSREVPSWGYSFRWQAPGLPTALTAEDLGYNNVLKGNLIEVGMYQDEKAISSLLGTVIASVTA